MEELDFKEIKKARNDHKCDLCCATISSGTRYFKRTIANDGTVYVFKSHPECETVLNQIMFDYCPDYGVDCNDFNEYVNDYIYDELNKTDEFDNLSLYEKAKAVAEHINKNS